MMNECNQLVEEYYSIINKMLVFGDQIVFYNAGE